MAVLSQSSSLFRSEKGGLKLLDNFPEKYWDLKEQGLSDEEIAAELFMSKPTLSKYKKRNNIITVKDVAQELGLTTEHLEIAKSNGLSRNHLILRIKHYGWSIEEAISKPVMNNQEAGAYRKK